MRTLQLRDLVEDSCEAHSYKDYKLTVTAEHEEDNFIIELIDLSVGQDPRALQLQLFQGEIASDRDSEVVSDYDVDKKYSILLNAHDVRRGDYFISVMCVSSHVEYQLIVTEINTQLLLGHPQNGQVCVDNWVYHTYTPERASPGFEFFRLRFRLTKITGAVQVMAKNDHAPVKLVPPYVPFNVGATSLEFDVCEAPLLRPVYLARESNDRWCPSPPGPRDLTLQVSGPKR